MVWRNTDPQYAGDYRGCSRFRLIRTSPGSPLGLVPRFLRADQRLYRAARCRAHCGAVQAGVFRVRRASPKRRYANSFLFVFDQTVCGTERSNPSSLLSTALRRTPARHFVKGRPQTRGCQADAQPSRSGFPELGRKNTSSGPTRPINAARYQQPLSDVLRGSTDFLEEVSFRVPVFTDRGCLPPSTTQCGTVRCSLRARPDSSPLDDQNEQRHHPQADPRQAATRSLGRCGDG